MALPAALSSMTVPLAGPVDALAVDPGSELGGDPFGLAVPPLRLVDALAGVPDNRDPRGLRHTLVSILSITACAMLAGRTSYVAIAHWAAGVPQPILAALGVRYDPVSDRYVPPVESTIRRALQVTCGDAFDAAIGGWVFTQVAPVTPLLGRLWGIAVDGKTARGSGSGSVGGQDGPVHLLAAFDHAAKVVLAQQQVDTGKTNEIKHFEPLLDQIGDLTGAVLTADAMHTQRSHMTYLNGRHAFYILIAKGNQRGLLAKIDALAWDNAPIVDITYDRRHGRAELRTLQTLPVPDTVAGRFPGAQQAFLVERYVFDLDGNMKSAVAVLGITSLAAGQATPAELAALIRAHWAIEVSLHWVRDVTLGEDKSQVRTANGPRLMASFRNLTISTINIAGNPSIADALRDNQMNHALPLHHLGINMQAA